MNNKKKIHCDFKINSITYHVNNVNFSHIQKTRPGGNIKNDKIEDTTAFNGQKGSKKINQYYKKINTKMF